MATGKIKWFNADKGYGFIEPDDGGKDLFVHISALEGSGIKNVSEGDPLDYDVVEGRNGKPQAENIVAL